MAGKMLPQRLLKTQNKTQTQSLKKIQADTDDHEHLVPWLFVARAAETEIAYDMPMTCLLELLQKVQERDAFTL